MSDLEYRQAARRAQAQYNESPNDPQLAGWLKRQEDTPDTDASGTDLRTALNGIHPEFLEQMEALMDFAQKTESRLAALEGGSGMPAPPPEIGGPGGLVA